MRDSISIKRAVWGYDPAYDRCEAFDDQGNHLGPTWFEKRVTAPNPPQGKLSNRRTMIGGVIAAMLAILFGIRR